MGYYVSGFGSIVFKDTKKALEALKETYTLKTPTFLEYNRSYNGFSFDITDSYVNKDNEHNLYTEVTYEFYKYSFETVEKFLKAIGPYLDEQNDNSISFEGEDGECWIMVYENGIVKEYPCIKVYPGYNMSNLSDKQLIEELGKRKYRCIR